MGLLSRRRLPRERTPRLDRDERVVAWAGGSRDEVVVVTNLGLWLPEAETVAAPGSVSGSGIRSRLGWHEIHKATWSGRKLTITAAREVAHAERYTVVADGPAVGYLLLDPDQVPDQVRSRVTRSVAYSEHHPLPDGGGVRVVGRRVPGVDGLRWVVRYDEGTDIGAEPTSILITDLVDRARRRVAPSPS
jgi:hypothetical protein